MDRKLDIEELGQGFSGRFQAMGSPCELLSEARSAKEAETLTAVVAAEAWRIEDKFSRYLDGNIIDQINTAQGRPITVDTETSQLLDFAETLYALSDSAFDITSGTLRRAWRFDGSDNIPSQDDVALLLDTVGWGKAVWNAPTLTLPPGMEIDLGGIGKEYAVDKVVLELRACTETPCLVNFGGDLAVTGAPEQRSAWTVGIEALELGGAEKLIELRQGALATSGDARRYLIKGGIRYSHVLDPRTGWPISEAASSITVAADSCTQAGMLATLAMLKGAAAEQFLDDQAEQYWCRRR
jgi:thiamine biosynthesis lipoprotein